MLKYIKMSRKLGEGTERAPSLDITEDIADMASVASLHVVVNWPPLLHGGDNCGKVIVRQNLGYETCRTPLGMTQTKSIRRFVTSGSPFSRNLRWTKPRLTHWKWQKDTFQDWTSRKQQQTLTNWSYWRHLKALCPNITKCRILMDLVTASIPDVPVLRIAPYQMLLWPPRGGTG